MHVSFHYIQRIFHAFSAELSSDHATKSDRVKVMPLTYFPKAAFLNAAVVFVLMLLAAPAKAYDGVCASKEDVAALPGGTWCRVSNSRLEDVEKSPQEWADWNGSSSASYESYQRITGIRGILAFSGGAYDSRRDRLLISGGGHNDYGGNEIMAFSLQTLSWERLTDPTAFPNRDPSSVNDDGTPISRHTYKSVEYISSTDTLFLLGGAPDSSSGGCGAAGAWHFDLRARELAGVYRPEQWLRIASIDEPESGCDVQSIHDRTSNRILYNSRRGWYDMDLRAAQWRKLNSAEYEQRKTFALIPGDANYLIHLGAGKFNGYLKRDLNSPDIAGVEVSTSGDRAIEDSDAMAFAYDTVSQKIIGWQGGANVFALDLTTNTWTRHTPIAENQVVPGGAARVYGRFRYSPVSNVFIVVTGVDEHVLLYKFKDGPGVPPEKSPLPPLDLITD